METLPNPNPEPKPTFKSISTESNRILKSNNRRVFISLSSLFIFPPSFTTIFLYAFLKPNYISTNCPIFLVAATIATLIFIPIAIASITFTTNQTLAANELTLIAAIKSFSATYFPLISTFLLYQSIITSIAIAYCLLLFFSTSFFPQISWIYALVIFTPVFVVLYMYVQVNLSLVYPVAVLESRCGFEAFKRSKELVTRHKRLVLLVSLYFGFQFCFMVWFASWQDWSLKDLFDGTARVIDGSDWWGSLLSQLMLVLADSVFFTMVQPYNIVAITVMYSFLRQNEDFAGEYVRLPANEEKVSSNVV